MRKYIKKLQAKPEGTRKQILVGSIVVCMILVCLVWISSLGYKFGNKEIQAKTEEGTKPFMLLGQTISDTYNNVASSVSNISSLKKDLSTKTEESNQEVNTEKQVDLVPVESSN